MSMPQPASRLLLRLATSRCRACSSKLVLARHSNVGLAVRRISQQSQQPKASAPKASGPKFQWIPVGLGIGFLGVFQLYRISRREKQEQRAEKDGSEVPKRRPRVRPDGPWQVQVMSTLPLKAISRIWGRFNSLDIPYYLRVPGFRLYSWIFGVNLDEIEEPDLHNFPNLAAFFYRRLKSDARPLDPDANALLSPADGRVLQVGQIEGGEIEQVKGMTYAIDSLLGRRTPTPTPTPGIPGSEEGGRVSEGDGEVARKDEEFARVNGISYTLPNLFSGAKKKSKSFWSLVGRDESTQASAASVSQVQADLALGEKAWYDILSADKRHGLYYAVIYLAPGDYHRFHSPTNWVVESRRHFAGELYSVSPYLQRTLPGLFTLNERVVLLGRWRHGFFSYVPVGATNVGSIKINFDKELRTNSLLTDTAADRAAEEATKRGEPHPSFAEATYAKASSVLGGYALRRGEEMGGFQLGSTIVLVFEAPMTERKGEVEGEGGVTKGWTWSVEKGQRVKMGQALGRVQP